MGHDPWRECMFFPVSNSFDAVSPLWFGSRCTKCWFVVILGSIPGPWCVCAAGSSTLAAASTVAEARDTAAMGAVARASATAEANATVEVSRGVAVRRISLTSFWVTSRGICVSSFRCLGL